MFKKFVRNVVKVVYHAMQKTSIGRVIEEEFEMFAYSGTGSRHFEYPFAISEVLKKKSKIKTILDAGSYGSLLPLILASMGFKVTGADINFWEVKFPNFSAAKVDLKKIQYKTRSFDCVTAVSTIEHVGLPRFREEIDENGDIDAMTELVRVLKKGGPLVLTVPYAPKYRVWSNKGRFYDSKRLALLTEGIKITKKEFFGPLGSGGHNFGSWTEKQANTKKFKREGDHCVVCLVGVKI
ncbi:MAG TPA: DUF268 domain-containing protein [Patescibacteria group bacterium]|nr:DUF268 domain-containing protein [Patescibacteria group bacterium]